MKKEDIAVILFSFALLAVVLTSFFYTLFTVKETKILDMNLRIGDYIGFNLDNKALEFGTMEPGGSSTRALQLENNYDFPLQVSVSFSPRNDLDSILGRSRPIKEEWITLSQNNFILESGKTADIKFTIKPDETPLGNYTAKAIITFFYVK